jgi:hypothetical protein
MDRRTEVKQYTPSPFGVQGYKKQYTPSPFGEQGYNYSYCILLVFNNYAGAV